MVDHASILEGTLIDYTDWVEKQTNISTSMKELRGIFFNKLIFRLRVYYPIYELRRSIVPEDILVTFETSGHIATLKFNSEGRFRAEAWRDIVIIGLNSALGEMRLGDYHDRFGFELRKVIKDLEKTLNYGRNKTTT